MSTPVDRARSLSAAVAAAGYPDHARTVRTLREIPARIDGARGVSLCVRYAVSEGPPGTWVADLLTEGGGSRAIATESGAIERSTGDDSEAFVSRSIRVAKAMWDAFPDDGERQEVLRALIERHLRERGRWPPRT
jgi:hypothetical protein